MYGSVKGFKIDEYDVRSLLKMCFFRQAQNIWEDSTAYAVSFLYRATAYDITRHMTD
jgi:hypothetical protein